MTPPAPPAPTGLPLDPSAAGGVTSPPPVVFKRVLRKREERMRAAALEASKAAAARRVTTPRVKEQMAAMKAAGMTDNAIGRAFSLTRTKVSQHLKHPDLVALIEQHRSFFRAMALEQTAGLVHKAFSRVNDALENDDAKAFDAYTRGIAAMERTGASASGENKPASVNVAVGVQMQMSDDEKADLMREFRKTVALEGERG